MRNGQEAVERRKVMDFIVGLFWLGFILVLASIVFGLVLGAFGFVVVIMGVINWVWERLKK